MNYNFGFVGTRFSGWDGVSLESNKWAYALATMGHTIFWFGGEIDKAEECSLKIPEAFFKHPEILEITEAVFGKRTRKPETSEKITRLKNYLKGKLYDFIKKFDIDILIAENCLTIPLNIPLGLALTEVIAERGIPVIAHHHDFYWERLRFCYNAVQDLLDMAFPPSLPSIFHVVINSFAQDELARRKSCSSFLIPNIIDFGTDPGTQIDEKKIKDFKNYLKLSDEDSVFIQPTRIIPRKGIENAIELVERLADPRIKLVVTHSREDEGIEYYQWLSELAQMRKIPVLFIDNNLHLGSNETFTLWDIYPAADLITYPSAYEGFGNAFLEAVYFKKPIIVNRYSVFISDIEPKGFKVIKMDGYLTPKAINQVKEVLYNKSLNAAMAEHNFLIGKKYFSFPVLNQNLNMILTSIYGEFDLQ